MSDKFIKLSQDIFADPNPILKEKYYASENEWTDPIKDIILESFIKYSIYPLESIKENPDEHLKLALGDIIRGIKEEYHDIIFKQVNIERQLIFRKNFIHMYFIWLFHIKRNN